MKKLSILLAFAASSCLFGQQMPGGTERLIAISRLWVTVNYFHPYIAAGKIDWDQALVRSLPQIRAAQTPAQYAEAIESLLDALHDPVTYALVRTMQPSPATLQYKTEGGTLVISQSAGKPRPRDIDDLRGAIQRAQNIVFDLRGSGYLSGLLDQPSVANELTPIPLDAPGERIWIHHGLKPLPGSAERDFYSAFETRPSRHFSGNPAAKRRRLVFLIDQQSTVPAIACALAGNGRAAVLSDSAHYAISGVKAVPIDMGAGVDAIVRLSEPVLPGGLGIPPIRRTRRDLALQQALAAIAAPASAERSNPLPAYPSPRVDSGDHTPAYPNTGDRILAAYKIWGAFHYFFAYRDQMDDDWDTDFKEFLPRIAAAPDAGSYNLAIAELTARVRDSDTKLQSKTLDAYFGQAAVGIRLRLIERKPVVTDVFDPVARTAGIRPGDVVLAVDGERIAERANREARYVPASTRQSLVYLVLQRVLNGPDGSLATLKLESPDGEVREVKLKRSKLFLPMLRDQRSGESVRILPGNIGYADLNRLVPDQVAGMFERLRNTKAAIFDMRGQSQGAGAEIAARLTERRNVPADVLTGALILAPDLPDEEALTRNATYFRVQKLPNADGTRYRGKTVMLIDERTAGRAERAALFFKAANGTSFIGTPSAGAIGNTTNFAVPGGIVISFSAVDVRLANGGQVQRLGLQPSIAVAPTIAGMRAGRDEVLQAAVEYLSQSR